MKKINVCFAFVLLMVVMLPGCTNQPRPQIETTSTMEPTYDGLYPIKTARVDRAWARLDLNLSAYTKIMLQSAGIQYRLVKPGAYYYGKPPVRTEFPMSEEKKERLQNLFIETFAKELQKSKRFTLVDEPGEDVLIVRIGLLDVVSKVPPESPGRSDIYLDSVGDATLFFEFIDSRSSAILARAMDRREANSADDRMFKSSPVTNWAEVHHMLQGWAILLRIRLDEVAAALGGS